MKTAILSSLLVLSAAASSVAIAHQQGEIIVRGGATTVAPDESTSTIIAGGEDLGVGLSIESNTQLGLNIAYFVTDNLNIELLAATPFKHDVDFGVTDPLGTGNKLGEVTHLPPTLTLNYYFNDASSVLQPYVGAGVNYTFIYDEEFTGANREAGLSDLSLDNSVGLSAQLGMDVMLDNNWHVNTSVRWIDIDTEASFNVGEARGAVNSIEIDPWVYTLAVGYTF
ncbi:OmpW family outer membrane protein [Salinimonas chungwhensis]|uniref:OmpW family outer membrane protein n=1 Tax=Salinimonas chungwhensis TaxID=265425 RepID=UPI000362FAC9|nr:OmpW family outer membrane protein [Salinimonas chungwhensis]